MTQLIIIMFLLITISTTMMLINFLISKKMTNDREKTSPFECGFDPMSSNHCPFSIHFFMISLIFLIFDIEITLLIPIVYLTKNYNHSIIIYSFMFFLILIYGLYMEYLEYSIDWKL